MSDEQSAVNATDPRVIDIAEKTGGTPEEIAEAANGTGYPDDLLALAEALLES